ncbi:Spb1 C-terminal domain-containing protein [Boeremia exigua]|uniref:Spb1 C-terminal domain-containing protein n=1 Tax=Boeremia exigua TaxID=749465 RepID=UPI001E8DADD4|nr:Spb1 C-terminal domain-containing protein [Boeremia exigua]KAH6625122.1 Spb1 C-terminal domain-containing protein [Boeremia exigua]
MAIQKKHGKGRLDKWYRLAKEKGYRARAAFKLIQLNKKYNFLEKSKVLIDLCAAPGSWCQVASEVMPAGALIVGVDLAPIKPIPRCITFQSDITTDKCRTTLRSHLKHLKADAVIHDGAPNVGTAWVQDAFSQAELVLQSMKLATEFLAEGGTFVTKVFRSKDYNALLWCFQQLFMKVEATKPPSSRNVSAEIFVVCRGYKAPKNLDPKFLDARYVFAELAEPTPNNEAKVFNPEKKKRKRGGYEEGDWTQFHEATVAEFIETPDPIAMLGSLNRLTFEQKGNGDIAIATIDKLKETTKEVRNCCADLKVLGRADFKRLLRWRLKVRDIFGFSKKQKDAAAAKEAEEAEEAKEGEEEAKIEDMDEEMKLQVELERLKDKDSKQKRKQRRVENERKQKEIVRMQMNMATPFDIGLEQAGPTGDDSMFALKAVEKDGALSKIARGKMAQIVEKEKEESSEEEFTDDEEGDNLERYLDSQYDEYVEQKSARDAKYRAKRARGDNEDGEWNGFSDGEKEESDDEELVQDADSDSDSSSDEEGPSKLTTTLEGAENADGLTRRAQRFFDQDIFKGIDGLDGLDEEDDDSGIDIDAEDVKMDGEDVTMASSSEEFKPAKKATFADPGDWSDDDASAIEEVARDESQWEHDDIPMKNGKPDIDIITAEAMTLAHQIATGAKKKHDLLDDSFNRYSLRDVDGLPDWFLDDENRHSQLQRPTTAAAANAIKEKMRALNARPIKKVREAHARKKFKAAQRLLKLKKKSALLADEEGMTEKEKAQSIARLMSRAAKKKPKGKVTVVVAGGGNRGIKGRPRGTKGKYKMVDARMKKDKRGMARAEKREKKRR